MQQKMQQQNQEFSELKTQINQFLKERKGLKAQVHELNDENNGLPWWAYLLLIMGGAGMGMLMSLLINRKYREKPASAPVAASLPAKPWIESPLQTKPVPEIVESSAETIEPNPSPVEDSRVPEPEKSDSNKSAMPLEPDLLQVSPDETVKSSPMESPSESGDSNAVDENPDDEEKLSEADYTVEFEPGLYKNLVEKKESEPLSPLEADNNSVDFVLGETVQKNEGSPVESRTAEVEVQKEEPLSKDEEDFFAAMDLDEKEAVPEQVPISSHPTESPDEKQPDDDENAAALVKSKTALDTLLALAKTYISMDDLQAARQSLQEVAEYGSEEQKDQARKLLDELKEKD